MPIKRVVLPCVARAANHIEAPRPTRPGLTYCSGVGRGTGRCSASSSTSLGDLYRHGESTVVVVRATLAPWTEPPTGTVIWPVRRRRDCGTIRVIEPFAGGGCRQTDYEARGGVLPRGERHTSSTSSETTQADFPVHLLRADRSPAHARHGDLLSSMAAFAPSVVERFLDEVVNGARPESARDLVHSEPLRKRIAALRSAFPDLRVSVDRVVVEGRYVAVHFNGSGTHAGSFRGRPPRVDSRRQHALDL